MPYIIKNGLTYTGNLIPITQAQYEALSEAEKNNGIAYFIVDSDAVLDASDVGLGEGNVEDLAGSVAVIETSPATAIHAVGDFILWNGQLYSVIDAIRVGQTLTVGSNITATSAGSEISALKNGLTDVTTTSLTNTATGFSFTGTFQKIGKLVTISGYMWTGTSFNTSTILGELSDASFKPSAITYVFLISTSGTARAIALRPDGKLTTSDSTLPAGTWPCLCCYIAN